ncbi:MAG: hypothetical protein OXU63_07560, partial [Acidobacteriota bacterium]|nr:hypothetical protein [Acidobacteriota bacterium]
SRARRLPQPPYTNFDHSSKPTAVTSNVSAPGKAYGIAILWDWLQNQLCDDIAENMSSCDDDYNQCLEDAFYSDIGDPNNADTVVKAQDCEINYLLCQLDQNKMSSACQWLLPLAPVPGDSPEPPGTVTPER